MHIPPPEEHQQALQAIGWTKNDFCLAAGVHIGTINRWHRGDGLIPSWVKPFMGLAADMAQVSSPSQVLDYIERTTPPHLSPEAFEDAIKAIGWKKVDFCRIVGTNAGTVSRWTSGEIEIPAWVRHFLTLPLYVAMLRSRHMLPPSRTPAQDA
ncbi:hypothetical protein [Kerstersia sp.]|uniref:hypothetical protein n=1 Tax=Kerstersia sp. TaxID=1930783 RepID=UPI003F90ECDF